MTSCGRLNRAATNLTEFGCILTQGALNWQFLLYINQEMERRSLVMNRVQFSTDNVKTLFNLKDCLGNDVTR